MKFALHLTDKPTGTHLGVVTDVLAWTVDDLGARNWREYVGIDLNRDYLDFGEVGS